MVRVAGAQTEAVTPEPEDEKLTADPPLVAETWKLLTAGFTTQYAVVGLTETPPI